MISCVPRTYHSSSAERPTSVLGAKEHLRARVAAEERHAWVPGRFLRWPYRVLVPLTAMIAERRLDGR